MRSGASNTYPKLCAHCGQAESEPLHCRGGRGHSWVESKMAAHISPGANWVTREMFFHYGFASLTSVPEPSSRPPVRARANMRRHLKKEECHLTLLFFFACGRKGLNTWWMFLPRMCGRAKLEVISIYPLARTKHRKIAKQFRCLIPLRPPLKARIRQL